MKERHPSTKDDHRVEEKFSFIEKRKGNHEVMTAYLVGYKREFEQHILKKNKRLVEILQAKHLVIWLISPLEGKTDLLLFFAPKKCQKNLQLLASGRTSMSTLFSFPVKNSKVNLGDKSPE